MIKKVVILLKTLVQKLASTMRRFPETVMLCSAAVTMLIVMNHMSFQKETVDLLTRICMILVLGVPMSLCIKVLFERIPNLKKSIKVGVYAGAVILLTLYFLFFLKDINMVSTSRYIAINISLYLAFSFIPHFFKRDNYELYVITLFTRFFVTYLYSLVLYLGLAAILLTIDKLFLVDVLGELYFDILLIVTGIFAPAFFLADIPSPGETPDVDNYSKVLRALLLYIIMPIILVYTVILYAFFGKILIGRQWPEGIVGNLVLWYSIISTLVIFFVYPLRHKDRWVNVFTSLFPKFALLPMVIMFISLGIRINAYGVTENRYFVLIAGLWVAGCMLYLTFAKNARNIVLTIALALISILAVSGPWSCYSISKLSQNVRFEKVLKRNDMLREGMIIKPSPDIAQTDKEHISSILLYFDRYHDLSDLKSLPQGFEIKDMQNLFGFELYYGADNRHFNHQLEKEQLFDIKGYDYFFDFPFYESRDFKVSQGSVDILYTYHDNNLKISRLGNIIYQKNIQDIAVKIHKKNKDKDIVDKHDMTFVDQTGDIKVLYLFNNIWGEETSNGEARIDSMRFYLFVELSD